MALVINNDELVCRIGKISIKYLGASVITESTFVDLSSKRTIALLNRLSSVQDRDLKVIGYLEFEFSESTLSCDRGTSQERNCSDVPVSPSIDGCDHADFHFLAA